MARVVATECRDRFAARGRWTGALTAALLGATAVVLALTAAVLAEPVPAEGPALATETLVRRYYAVLNTALATGDRAMLEEVFAADARLAAASSDTIAAPAAVSDAAGVLICSFADDPGLRYVLPNIAARERLGPSLAHAVIRYALRCGAPLVTPGAVRGVALWFPPDAPAPTDADLAETGLAAVPEQIGPDAWRRFQRLLDHLDALHPRYAPEPHWYLAMLGVDPAWQRRGLGEALLRPVFAAADRDGLSCYLEAPTEDNARYYERRGFRVLAETDVPDSDVHVWLMRRDPAH